VQPGDEVALALTHQGEEEVTAVVAIGQEDRSRGDRIQQLTQERRLPDLLARIGPEGHALDHRRGQREEDDQPHERKPHPGLLGVVLRVLVLVVGRVGHAHRGPVDQQDRPAVPPRVVGHGRLAPAADLFGQPPQPRLRQSGPRPAIGPAVQRAGRTPHTHQQHQDPCDRRQARSLLLLEQDLGEKGPEGHRRRVDRVFALGEARPFLGEDRFDPLFRKHVGKGQPLLLQERGEDPPESREPQTSSVIE